MSERVLKCVDADELHKVASDKKMKIGIMGGSFDPIHNGHLILGSEAQKCLSLDRVFYTPTKNSSIKSLAAPIEKRYEMTVIATSSNPIFSVSRVDIDRESEFTYTIDTVNDFRKLYPNAELYFISGLDAISHVDEWKDYEELKKLVKFVAGTRPGYTNEKLSKLDCDLTVLEIPGLDVSSTDCRKRVEEGRPIWYLVPDGVVQYIEKEGIYRSNNCLRII